MVLEIDIRGGNKRTCQQRSIETDRESNIYHAVWCTPLEACLMKDEGCLEEAVQLIVSHQQTAVCVQTFRHWITGPVCIYEDVSVGVYLCVLIKASRTFRLFESVSGRGRLCAEVCVLVVGGCVGSFASLHYVNSVYVVHWEPPEGCLDRGLHQLTLKPLEPDTHTHTDQTHFQSLLLSSLEFLFSCSREQLGDKERSHTLQTLEHSSR